MRPSHKDTDESLVEVNQHIGPIFDRAPDRFGIYEFGRMRTSRADPSPSYRLPSHTVEMSLFIECFSSLLVRSSLAWVRSSGRGQRSQERDTLIPFRSGLLQVRLPRCL